MERHVGRTPCIDLVPRPFGLRKPWPETTVDVARAAEHMGEALHGVGGRLDEGPAPPRGPGPPPSWRLRPPGAPRRLRVQPGCTGAGWFVPRRSAGVKWPRRYPFPAGPETYRVIGPEGSRLTAMAFRTIIDTDPGIDDALALLLALRSPELRGGG